MFEIKYHHDPSIISMDLKTIYQLIRIEYFQWFGGSRHVVVDVVHVNR